MTRPWHIPLPGTTPEPWPTITPSQPPTPAEVAALVAASQSRYEHDASPS